MRQSRCRPESRPSKSQLELAAGWSESQLTREERSGNICGLNGGAIRVGLIMSRRNLRDTVTHVNERIAKSWFTPVQAEIEMLRQAASALEKTFDTPSETGAHNPTDKLSAQVRGGARSIAYRHNALGSVSAVELRNLANTISVPPGQAGFVCHDPMLASRLLQAADHADEPVRLQLREAVFSAGPAGVANAVHNLWSNISVYANSLVTVASSGSALASPAKAIDHTSGGEPVKSRDMLALMTTLALNLGLFVLAIRNRVPAPASRRAPVPPPQPLGALSQPSALRHIAAALHTALERAPGADLEWLRQHFVHHAGVTYFVIPNLGSMPNISGAPILAGVPAGEHQALELRAMALNQLAGVLEDIRLIRTVGPSASTASMSGEGGKPAVTARRPIAARRIWKSTAQAVTEHAEALARQELLSKADRALAIAGWSADSKREIEVFQIVHSEGTAPLLCLINQATLDQGIRAAEEANRWPAGHPRHRPLRLEYHRSA